MTTTGIPAAIVVDEKDNVATAVQPIRAGRGVRIQMTKGTLRLNVIENIPMGHKVAIRDMHKDEHVIKFGEAIGRLTGPVRSGSHVHVHNVESIRGSVVA